MSEKRPQCPRCGSLMCKDYENWYCLSCGTRIEPKKVTITRLKLGRRSSHY